ncbi:MAG TPA: transcriptional regulator, partial [Methanofollis liminatans]|nr:transcriptional regulator [Methanofollis liminatans]
IFTNVSTGKSPLVAIRVTPFKPRCVILQGLDIEHVHPLVKRLAETDRITVLCTSMDVDTIVSTLREKEW